jgi:prophage tail gpP-like protein
VETLLAPFGVEIEWGAADLSLDKIRFRDGGRVVDELQRLAEQAGLYIHEGRDGKLKVSDGAGAAQGEPLVLGRNILQFSADQADDPERSEILVKGQRTEVGIWGNDAVIPTMDNAIDAVVSRYTPITVQLYGNATPELLARRTEYEANRRSSAAKKINLDVFHVQQPSGMPWDIGDIHYVEIPPAGIYGMFEVTDLTYNVDADQTLKTSLTLSPAPTAYGRDRGGFLSALPEIDTLAQEALQRAGAAGAAISAALWSGPALSSIALPTLDLPQTPAAQFLGGLLAGLGAPPLTISEDSE